MLKTRMNHKIQKPSILQVVASVLAALFGVQSSANRERDFQHGQWWIYILVGFLAVVIFVLGLVVAVKLLLAKWAAEGI